MPVTLGIDTTASCRIILRVDGNDRVVETVASQALSTILIDNIDALLKSAKLTVNDITNIVVCRGPGSFTGIRVGISFAKSFALALGIPVFGVDSITALINSYSGSKDNLLVLIDTKRNDCYMAYSYSKNDVRILSELNIKDIAPNTKIIGTMGEGMFGLLGSYDVLRMNFSMQSLIDEGLKTQDSNITASYYREPEISTPKLVP